MHPISGEAYLSRTLTFSNASNVLCRPKSVTLTTRNLRWPEIRHLRFACAVHFTSLEPLLALHPSVQMATL